MNLKKLPALAPQRTIDRPLSFLEYYFASTGRSSASHEDNFEIFGIIESDSCVSESEWEVALAQVVAVNPACRLRMVGRRQHSRWRSDGPPMRLRYLEAVDWDGRSNVGSEFIAATPLNLEQGPTSELIVLRGNPYRIIIRVHHAVMDGVGIIHCFQELFRALRGEPLLGTNAIFSDSDLRRGVTSQPPPKYRHRPATLTGARSTAIGNVWRRITVEKKRTTYLLGSLAIWSRQFSQRYSSGPVRILVPVSLRRHCADLTLMTNLVGLLIVELDSIDTPADFRRKLNQQLDGNVDAYQHPAAEFFKYLPMSWLDWIGAKSARHHNAKDTLAISNLGVISAESLTCEKFSARTIFFSPALDGNPFIVVSTMRDTLELTVSMPEELASDGRLDAFVEFLTNKLQEN